jgi:hypothetical protein
VATWLYSLFIQEQWELFNPVPSIAAITVYSKDSSHEMIHVEICNIPECDEAIFKTPVTSVLLPRTKIEDDN